MSGWIIVIGLIIGLTMGTLGGGGSILTVPALVYGLGFDAKAAITTSLVVVGATSLMATAQQARAGTVAWREGLIFGGAGMVTAVAGARVSEAIPAQVLLVGFAAVMVVSAVGMLRGRPEVAGRAAPSAAQSAGLGAAVGLVTGLLGAGGGFLIVPALVLVGGLPMKTAVGTSLLVITLNAVAGLAGRSDWSGIGWGPTAELACAAIVGALAGGAVAGRLPAEVLRKVFAGLVLVIAALQLWMELG